MGDWRKDLEDVASQLAPPTSSTSAPSNPPPPIDDLFPPRSIRRKKASKRNRILAGLPANRKSDLQRSLITRTKRERVYKRDGYTCQFCHRQYGKGELTLDHIVKIEHGGGNEDGNLRTVCRVCHDDHHRQEKMVEKGGD